MKRNVEGRPVSSAAGASDGNKLPMSHWKNALKYSLEDSSLHVDKTDLAVMIKDKYPKVECVRNSF